MSNHLLDGLLLVTLVRAEILVRKRRLVQIVIRLGSYGCGLRKEYHYLVGSGIIEQTGVPHHIVSDILHRLPISVQK